VHNTFLLTAAELGVLGAILFWLPVTGLLAMAWISRRRPGFAGPFALAVIASAPGLYLVNSSGWAVLSGPLLPLWFLVYGFAYSQFGSAGRLLVWLQRAPRSIASLSASAPVQPAHTQALMRSSPRAG
jgi:hypothetical protein